MKILYVTTIGITMGFFKDFIKELTDAGHTVDIATNTDEAPVPECYHDWGCRIFKLDCNRSPFSAGNLRAISQIKRLADEGHYDIVHCHTPIAAACTRIACRSARKHGTKVLYTAHGFHFYKGAPKKNWLVYYPVEWLCAHWTDTLITINQEDYALAKQKFAGRGGCQVVYVPGVGIDLSQFGELEQSAKRVFEECGKQDSDRASKRKELGLPDDAFVLLSVGELNENKNHETVIRALAGILAGQSGTEMNAAVGLGEEKDAAQKFYYLIAGEGKKRSELQALIDESGLSGRVQLLGFRSDVAELYRAADLFVFPSFREGLSVSLMEAMASGLPCCVSRIRGNSDLIDEKGGALFDPANAKELKAAIENLSSNSVLARACGKHNREKVQAFSFAAVEAQMQAIYQLK